MNKESIYIACYGTLRKNGSNSRLIDTGDNHKGTGITVEKYQMKERGIPFVNKTPDTQIVVDVWEVQERDLPRVDILEGYDPKNHDGSWYKRELIPVNLNGKTIEAWLYFNNDDGRVVKSGDFNKK